MGGWGDLGLWNKETTREGSAPPYPPGEEGREGEVGRRAEEGEEECEVLRGEATKEDEVADWEVWGG